MYNTRKALWALHYSRTLGRDRAGTKKPMTMTAQDQPGMRDSDRREHLRVTQVELVVRFDGQTYKTSNWSMGGFLIDDYDGALSTGALVTVKGLGRNMRKIGEVNLPARVVRSGEKVIAVNYLSLDAAGYTFLQEIMRESGKMRTLLDQSA